MSLKDLFSKAPSPPPLSEEPWPQPVPSSSNSSSNCHCMSPLYSVTARPTVDEFLRTNYLMIPEFVQQVNRAKIAANKGGVGQSVVFEESTSLQGTAHRRKIISFDSLTRDINSENTEKKEDGIKEIKGCDSNVKRGASGAKSIDVSIDTTAAQNQASVRDLVVPPLLKPKPRVKKVMKGGTLVTIPAPQIRKRPPQGFTANDENNVESGVLSEQSEGGKSVVEACLLEGTQNKIDQSCKDDPSNNQLATGKHDLVTPTHGSKDIPGEVSSHQREVSGSEIVPKKCQETQVLVSFIDNNIPQDDKNNTDENSDFGENRSFNTMALLEKDSTNPKEIVDKRSEETPTGPMQESIKAKSNDEFKGNIPLEESEALSSEDTNLSENQGEYFSDYQTLDIDLVRDLKEKHISKNTDGSTTRVREPLRPGSILAQLKSPHSSSTKKQEELSSDLPKATGSSMAKQSSEKLNMSDEEHSEKIKQNENSHQNQLSSDEKSQLTEIIHWDKEVTRRTRESCAKGIDRNAEECCIENSDAGNHDTGVFNESADVKKDCTGSIDSINSDHNANDNDDQENGDDDYDKDDDDDGNDNTKSVDKGDSVADDGGDEYAELVMVESTSDEDEEEYDNFLIDENDSDGEESKVKSDYEAEDMDLDSDNEGDTGGISFHQDTTIGQRVKYSRGRQKDNKRTARNRRKKFRKKKRAKRQNQRLLEKKKCGPVSGHKSTDTPEKLSEIKTLPVNNPPREKSAEPGSLLSMVSSYSVDLTVAASEKLLKRKTRGGQHAKKLKKAKRTAEALERKRSGEPPPRTKPVYKELLRPICSFYIQGKCRKGSECSFRHDRSALVKKKAICRFYVLSADNCQLGDDCAFMHSSFPCKFFHTIKSCREGSRCRFSHDALTEETSRILQEYLNPVHEDADQLPEGTDFVALNQQSSDPQSPVEDTSQSGHLSPYNLRTSARKRVLGCDGTTPGGQGTFGKLIRLGRPAKAEEDGAQDAEEQMGPFVPGLYRDLSI